MFGADHAAREPRRRSPRHHWRRQRRRSAAPAPPTERRSANPTRLDLGRRLFRDLRLGVPANLTPDDATSGGVSSASWQAPADTRPAAARHRELFPRLFPQASATGQFRSRPGNSAAVAAVSKTVVGGFVHRGVESHPSASQSQSGIRRVSDRATDLRRNRLVLVVARSTRANASLPRPLQDFVPPSFPGTKGPYPSLPTCSGMDLPALSRSR
jgi:hypothetical protein